MTEETKPRALIIENIKASRQLATQALESSGWEVICEETTEKVFQLLENSKKSPFSLIISGVKMPDMDGDEILTKAGEISPVTQRMLIIPVEEKDILIRAINMANIHACISYPFKEEDLISESERCNRFKKRNLKNKQRIKEKKLKILQLKSQQRQQTKEDVKNLTLDSFVEYKKLPRKPNVFFKEFETVSDYIKSFIKQNADKHSLEWKEQNLNEIIAGKPENFEPHELVENLTILALINSLNIKNAIPDTPEKDPDIKDDTLEYYLELIVSDDYITAWLRKKREIDKKIVTLTSILDFLRESQINYGIIDDKTIEEWLDKPYTKDDKIAVAKGKECVPGKEGKIIYNFQTDYSNPGKILEDGTIDFRERGEVPFVKKGDILASLHPPQKGVVGINLAGSEIPVDEIVDLPFSSESGTILSDDGLNILADAQPDSQ